ncbi:RPOLA_N domain-containing protein [Trichonephila clavipes]|nr:RPOLA_N domain-containing protein [Trichonephila clavipes]
MRLNYPFETFKGSSQIKTGSRFLVLPDPIFWQVVSTLVYEKIMKFVQGLPMTSRTKTVQSPSKVGLFYKQILETPLNYGSLQRRSCGKSTFGFDKWRLGKAHLYP